MLSGQMYQRRHREPGRDGVGTLDLDWAAWVSILILKSYDLAISSSIW